MKLVVQIDLTFADLAAFERYEAAVLPLLADHGGVLEQRLRAVDGSSETHVIGFVSPEGFEAYLADPRRTVHAQAFALSGAKAIRWEVGDIP
jgi:hypothetical protein